MTRTEAMRIRHEAIRRARWAADTRAAQGKSTGRLTPEIIAKHVRAVCTEHGTDFDDPALQQLLAGRSGTTSTEQLTAA